MGRAVFVAILVIGFPSFLCEYAGAQAENKLRVQVEIVTDEADEVLNILAKKQSNSEITNSAWNHVFTSEGYVRLKERELGLQRPFEDSEFRAFVLSEGLQARRQALAETLALWKRTDVAKVAERSLAYLPKSAVIKAKIYPVIKPRENSFVTGFPDDPAIFLYLDPLLSTEKFENTLAHELHHIGFGTACPPPKAAREMKKLAAGSQKVLRWIGAFGEGFAMLAAAGGPDIHPHAVSSSEDRTRWDRDVANFENDLQTVEKFFIELSDGKLSEGDEMKTASSFFGIQGPWYTVGWKMAVVIEKTYGRASLIDSMCDQRELLITYNKAAKKYFRRQREKPILWSDLLLERLR